MKNLKSLFVAAAILLTANTINAQAVTGRSSATLNAGEPLTVKYLGNEGDYLLFEVVAKPTDKNSSSFEIADKEEGELYYAYVDNVKRQMIKIEKRASQELSFKLITNKATYTRSFVINNATEQKTTVSEATNITML